MSETIDRITIGETTKMIKDTTYESKQASQGGTDVSLVTTGEKYIWNGKLTSPSTAGTSGQVLTSDGQGGQNWQTPSSGTITDVQVNGTSVVSSGVANVPIGNQGELGVVKGNPAGGVIIDDTTGELMTSSATSTLIKRGDGGYKPISPSKQHEAVFWGLSKVAGVDLANETVTVGTYPTNSQTAIRSLIGAGTYSKPSGGIPSTDIASGVIPDVSGKVDGASSSTNNHVAIFDGTTGKTIKDSGYTIGKSVPSDAVFTDTTYSAATQSDNGLMSSTDKTKLDGIASGATANTGTITGITMNGVSKGTSGVVDLGTVITSHQDISGKISVVSSATFGDIATFNYSGSIQDSGYKISDLLNLEIIKISSPISIPNANSTDTYTVSGITSSHILAIWNFSDSYENEPPTSLEWITNNGSFSITNTGTASNETIQPVFVVPTSKTATLQSQ